MSKTKIHQESIQKYLTDTADARRLSERDRDYFDHKQWTAHEVTKLKARGQAPIVVNRIKPKVEGLMGLYNLRKVDPKAYPRTAKHEESAHVITDGLRYVADNNDFDNVKVDIAEDFWIEGTGASITDVKQKKNGEVEIRVQQIPWDRFYFDPHSREKDFSDARFLGMIMWLGADQVKEMFPNVKLDDITEFESDISIDETFADRPNWYQKDKNRVKVAYHFFIKNGVWHYVIFSGDVELVAAQESPFLDDDGEPTCIIEAVSANVDRQNNRYGEVRGYIDGQDEINHRRSKALHLLGNRQTFGRQGSVKDVARAKRELAKPDGHVEFQGEEFGKDFGMLPTSDMAAGQLNLYIDAKAELDAIGFNAQLAGQRQSGDLSGKAIDRLQQAGTIELNRQFALLNGLEKRIYRQIWARIKQFWNEEKWIRITDDQEDLRWVGLNAQVKTKDWLEEQMADESRPLDERQKLAATYQFLMAAAQQGNQEAAQKLEEIIEVKNDTSELDVDIIVDQSFDVINIQAEQFAEMSKLAQTGMIDVIDLLKMSGIRGKDEIIAQIEARQQAQAQAAQQAQAVEAQNAQMDNAKKYAEVQLTTQKAEQVAIENISLQRSPDEDPQVTV